MHLHAFPIIQDLRLGQVKAVSQIFWEKLFSYDNSSEPDVCNWIGLATGASAALNTIWASKGITQETVAVWESNGHIVLSILLYNSETWTLKESDKPEALGVSNVSPHLNYGCVQERQVEEWRHQSCPVDYPGMW